jgi:hypothetical protein
MKYLKLFENFNEEILFYRFSIDEMKINSEGSRPIFRKSKKQLPSNHSPVEEPKIIGEEWVDYKPGVRGDESPDWNNICMDKGFPDRNKCLHFMSESAYRMAKSPEAASKNIFHNKKFGINEYQIKVDENTNIGWTFFVMIGEWYMKNAEHLKNKLESAEIPDNSIIKKWNSEIDPYYIEKSNKLLDELIKLELIGTGKISDLKNSKYWKENVPCYVWTSDKVKIKKI